MDRHMFELRHIYPFFLGKNVAHTLKCQVGVPALSGQVVVMLLWTDRLSVCGERVCQWRLGLRYRFESHQ